MRNIVTKPRWLVEMVAVWGYVQRNYFLTKRYFMWEIVWLVYITANAMAITFIGAGVESVGGAKVDTAYLMTFLMVGALIWSYLSVLFDVLSETVSWERWEGTIEYTRSEEHTSELQSRQYLVCRLLLEKQNRVARRAHSRRHPPSTPLGPR